MANMSDKIPILNLWAGRSIDEDALTSAYDPGHRLRILVLYYSIQHRFYLCLVAEEST